MSAPARVGTAAAGVALATLVLAGLGFLGWRLELLPPLLARGALVVAIGGAILGATLSAIGLLVTRPPSDPTGRPRAWLGAVLSVALLLVLIAAFEREIGGPIPVERSIAPGTMTP